MAAKGGKRGWESKPVASAPIVEPSVPSAITIDSIVNGFSAEDRQCHRAAYLHLMQSLQGTEVDINVRDGRTIRGLFYAANPFPRQEHKIVVKAGREIKNGTLVSDGVEAGSTVITKFSDILTVKTGKLELNHKNYSSEFQTDSSIKKHGDMSYLDGRDLQSVSNAWLDPTTNTTLGGDAPSGGRQWDQFEANRKLFNVNSTFDENLYTKKLEKNKLTAAQIAHAEKMAREIEAQMSSNIHLQEERGHAIEREIDEEDLYSGVQRTPAYVAPGTTKENVWAKKISFPKDGTPPVGKYSSPAAGKPTSPHKTGAARGAAPAVAGETAPSPTKQPLIAVPPNLPLLRPAAKALPPLEPRVSPATTTVAESTETVAASAAKTEDTGATGRPATTETAESADKVKSVETTTSTDTKAATDGDAATKATPAVAEVKPKSTLSATAKTFEFKMNVAAKAWTPSFATPPVAPAPAPVMAPVVPPPGTFVPGAPFVPSNFVLPHYNNVPMMTVPLPSYVPPPVVPVAPVPVPVPVPATPVAAGPPTPAVVASPQFPPAVVNSPATTATPGGGGYNNNNNNNVHAGHQTPAGNASNNNANNNNFSQSAYKSPQQQHMAPNTPLQQGQPQPQQQQHQQQQQPPQQQPMQQMMTSPGMNPMIGMPGPGVAGMPMMQPGFVPYPQQPMMVIQDPNNPGGVMYLPGPAMPQFGQQHPPQGMMMDMNMMAQQQQQNGGVPQQWAVPHGMPPPPYNPYMQQQPMMMPPMTPDQHQQMMATGMLPMGVPHDFMMLQQQQQQQFSPEGQAGVGFGVPAGAAPGGQQQFMTFQMPFGMAPPPFNPQQQMNMQQMPQNGGFMPNQQSPQINAMNHNNNNSGGGNERGHNNNNSGNNYQQSHQQHGNYQGGGGSGGGGYKGNYDRDRNYSGGRGGGRSYGGGRGGGGGYTSNYNSNFQGRGGGGGGGNSQPGTPNGNHSRANSNLNSEMTAASHKEGIASNTNTATDAAAATAAKSEPAATEAK